MSLVIIRAVEVPLDESQPKVEVVLVGENGVVEVLIYGNKIAHQGDVLALPLRASLELVGANSKVFAFIDVKHVAAAVEGLRTLQQSTRGDLGTPEAQTAAAEALRKRLES